MRSAEPEGAVAASLHRAGVGRRRREGAQADHHAHVPRAGQPDHGVGEGAPVEVGLGADEDRAGRGPTRPCRAARRCAGQVRSVVMPLTIRATGRRARWSRKWSPLKVTTASVCALAEQGRDGRRGAQAGVDPALEADDQRTARAGRAPGGLRRSRSARRPRRSRDGLQRRRPRISKRRPICAGNPSTLPLVTRARRRHVAGVDPFQNAAELPVPEGHVEVDAGEVAVRHRP